MGDMSAKACIILNPASGQRGDRRDETPLRREKRVEIRELSEPGDLQSMVEKAISDGCDPIIAAGGDGTISGIAGVLAGTGRRLGILPFGTFNYFARRLGIPDDPGDALRCALDGAETPLTIGVVNDRVFLNNASLGAYALILQVREGVYSRWGRSRLAAYWSVILAMISVYRPMNMTVTVDGQVQQLRAPMAFVSVSPFQLEEMGLDGAEAVRAGKLALLVPRDTARLKLLWRALRVFFRGARRHEDYLLLTGEEIVIETPGATRLVARDGEREKVSGPYRFRIRKDALSVKVPESRVAVA
jgi:diacylglycerol kinase family enzyme